MNQVIHNYKLLHKISQVAVGKDAQGVVLTGVKGKPGYFGTDAYGEVNKAIPVSDISATPAVFLFGTEPNNDGIAECIFLDNALITTDNLDLTDLPAVGALVYIGDDAKWGATNTDTAGGANGRCVVLNPNYASTKYRTILCHYP